ncbi:hypothetical protein EKG83_28515 [Saccharothrix syringae]|uniref:Uncharacterized protein n=1 Tax=Saccharothrix syringae TaxID=103733 RepID=A0A5Q0H4G7_SACSY|nr:hypothetical protein EKG83_28515 [Saccharothrix syringae]
MSAVVREVRCLVHSGLVGGRRCPGSATSRGPGRAGPGRRAGGRGGRGCRRPRWCRRGCGRGLRVEGPPGSGRGRCRSRPAPRRPGPPG